VVDFSGLRIGPDNLPLSQVGTVAGSNAKFDTGGFPIQAAQGVASSDLTTLGQVNSIAAANTAQAFWQNPAISELVTPPVSPTTGNRYLVAASATGAFSGQTGKIAQWSGSVWVFYSPATGWFLKVLSETSRVRMYSGSAWLNLYFNAAYLEQKFTVGVGGQTTFVCSPIIDILSGSRLDVYRNGLLLEESDDYTKNVGTESVVFSYTVPENATVRVRQWLE
jgi:hypothetical protein